MRAIRWTALAAGLALSAAAVANPPAVGQPAPPFHAKLLDGTQVSLDDFRGNVVVVNFWATWCVPCKAELPRLDAFYRANEAAGLRVIAVTTEDSLPVYRLKPLTALLKVPLVRSFHGSYAPLNGAVPTNFVIDRAGIVRYAKAGAFTIDELNDLLVPLLREPGSASGAPAAGR